jgi:DnaJ-class molecular chaperone
MFFDEGCCGYLEIPDPVQTAPVVKRIRTHYDNLKVSRTATFVEIRASYRRLRSLYHPDRNSTAKAKTAIICINDAYEILSDATERAKYDAFIVAEERKLNPPRPQQQHSANANPAKAKHTQYAQDPANWNPEHAADFRKFVQEKRVEFGEVFGELSTDWLYMCFLEDLRMKTHSERLEEKARKAKILVICCFVSLILGMIYMGFLIAQSGK